MARFFRKSLGFILLFATIGLASCQSLFNDSSKDSAKMTVKKNLKVIYERIF